MHKYTRKIPEWCVEMRPKVLCTLFPTDRAVILNLFSLVALMINHHDSAETVNLEGR